jgi:hypothetical protein
MKSRAGVLQVVVITVFAAPFLCVRVCVCVFWARGCSLRDLGR